MALDLNFIMIYVFYTLNEYTLSCSIKKIPQNVKDSFLDSGCGLVVPLL